MTDQPNHQCTCRSTPLERVLDPECPTHGDAEERRRREAACQWHESLSEEDEVFFRDLIYLRQSSGAITIDQFRARLEASEGPLTEADFAALYRGLSDDQRRRAVRFLDEHAWALIDALTEEEVSHA